MIQVLRALCIFTLVLTSIAASSAQQVIPQFSIGKTQAGHEFLYMKSDAQDTVVVSVALEGGSVKESEKGPRPRHAGGQPSAERQ